MARHLTREGFGNQLKKLQDVIGWGLSYYTVYLRVMFRDDDVAWSLAQQNRVLNGFRGFFAPVGRALQDMALLQFAKVFEDDDRTASFPVLIDAARNDPTLLPNCGPSDLDRIEANIDLIRGTLDKLMRHRNWRLAHVSANAGRAMPISKGEFDELVETVKATLDALSTAHDGSGYVWDFMTRQADNDTRGAVSVLLDRLKAEGR